MSATTNADTTAETAAAPTPRRSAMTIPSDTVTLRAGARRAPFGRLLRAELRWAFRRPRTIVGLTLFGLLPVVIGIGIVIADQSAPQNGGGGDGALLSYVVGNGVVLPIATMSLALTLLLPLAAAMSAADAIAGESASGTLRGLLLAPVSRPRLLAMKAFGVASVVAAATGIIAVVGVITGLIISGRGDLITLSGTTLSFGTALWRVLLVFGWVTLQLLAVAAIALAISTLTDHPLVVVALTLGGLIIFSILPTIPALEGIRPVLLPDGWGALIDVLRDPIPSEALLNGVWRALAYIGIGYSLATARLVFKEG